MSEFLKTLFTEKEIELMVKVHSLDYLFPLYKYGELSRETLIKRLEEINELSK